MNKIVIDSTLLNAHVLSETLSCGARAVHAALKARIVWVEAPSGWGKTTAVRDAVKGSQTVWCDLGAAPNERGALIFSLVQALSLPTEQLGPLLHAAARTDSLERIRTWLSSALPPELDIIAIDDLHRVADDTLSLSFLEEFLEECKRYKVVLITRPNTQLSNLIENLRGIGASQVRQHQLALTQSGVARLLLRGGRDTADAKALFHLSGGSPLVLNLALAVLTDSPLDASPDVSRDLAFHYLASQLLQKLDLEKRCLILSLALAGKFDSSLIKRLGYDVSAMNWVLSSAFPVQCSGKEYRLHDLFADVVCAQVNDQELSESAARVVDALNLENRLWQAFDLSRLRVPHKLSELLATYGEALFESGRWESFRSAIEALPREIRTDNASVLAVRAVMEQAEGNRSRAEMLYLQAISRTQGDGQLRGALLRQFTKFYNDLLSEKSVLIGAEAITFGSRAARCEARAYYAVALAIAGRSEALWEAERAIKDAEELDDQRLIWIAYQQAELTASYTGDDAARQRIFPKALQAAHRLNDPRAIAYTLYGLVTDGDSCSRIEGLREVEGLLTGVQDRWLHAYVLIAKYWIASERGDEDLIDHLNVESSRTGLIVDSSLHVQIARSMRLAWSGEFEKAYAIISSVQTDSCPSLYQQRWKSAVALFAALARRGDAAQIALNWVSDRASICKGFPARLYDTASIYAAFAEIFLGHKKRAVQRLPIPRFNGDAPLCDAVRSLAALPNPTPRQEVLKVAAELAEREQEGFAALLIAWANAYLKAEEQLSLTATEVVILRRVSEGATAKEIAAETTRSVETIRNHTKAIIRKLGVSGRVEAVSAARRIGLI